MCEHCLVANINFNISDYIQIGLLIIAFTTTFVPAIITVINNIHNSRMRKLEIISEIQQNLLSEFSKQSTRYLENNHFVREFYDSINLLYVYFEVDDKLLEDVINSKTNRKTFQIAMANFMKDLSKQIKCK